MTEKVSVSEQAAAAAKAFERQFGRAPRFAAAAPGRVNLIGEHTDYNDGFVFPMAIERDTVIVADLSTRPTARLASDVMEGVVDIPVDRTLTRGKPAWSNYVRGVVAGFVAKGHDVPAFDAMISSTVPLGGGLSSSASLEVATATLLEAMTGVTLKPVDKALLCQKAEHDFAGMPCGIMDQFISTMAKKDHAMLLDCRSHATQMVPLTDPNVSVLIANTNVKHELTGSEYPQRRAQCEAAAKALGVPSLRDATMAQLEAKKGGIDNVVYRRARHIISEIHRTVEAAELARKGDWTNFGKRMHDSHVTLRDDFEVSCKELDVMVELAMLQAGEGGVFGSRMTGGGFGGCTVTLLRTGAVDEVSRHLAKQYQQHTGIEPTIFATRPAAGARVLNL